MPQGSCVLQAPFRLCRLLNGLSVEIKANLYENAVFLLFLHVDSGLESGACPPAPGHGSSLGSACPLLLAPKADLARREAFILLWLCVSS